MQNRLAGGQNESAAKMLNEAGVRHGDVSRGQLTVGFTPAAEASPATLHFCSSSVTCLQLQQRGDGNPIPVRRDYALAVAGNVPKTNRTGLLRTSAQFHPNGVLNVTLLPGPAKILPTPASVAGNFPHAHSWGPDEIVDAYGCATLDEAFEKHGELIEV